MPVVDGSLVDLAALCERDVTKDEVNAAFQAAGAAGPLAGRLRYTTDPVVSTDVNRRLSLVRVRLRAHPSRGQARQSLRLVDNEWGYTARLVDLTRLVAHTS